MAVSSILRAIRGSPSEKNTPATTADIERERAEKDGATDDAAAVDSYEDERPGEDLQRGVQQVEAVTLSWSKGTLIAVFLKYVAGCHTILRLSRPPIGVALTLRVSL